MNRERAPETWWSPEWGLIWSDDDYVYRRAEGERVVEFLHLPRHAHPMEFLCTECGDTWAA